MGQESSTPIGDDVPPETLSARTLEGVAELINSGGTRRIVVLTGAGISTAAGSTLSAPGRLAARLPVPSPTDFSLLPFHPVPDFRSPNTGLYANLSRLNLPRAEAVFDIQYFRENPVPFYVLAKELYPGRFRPTVSHAFVALLARRGLLAMLFTQNIDCLERAAGVPPELLIEAHGSFATQRCIDCGAPFADDAMRDHVARGAVPRCAAAAACRGLVKPDITFFGEKLPERFFAHLDAAAAADLVLVLGTSLSVHPFAGLPGRAAPAVPRVLFNLEAVGGIGSRPDDVLALGPCDAGVRRLADALGWRDELETLWKDLVGDDEARRQNARAAAAPTLGDGDGEAEAAKLADEVEKVLKLTEDDEDASKRGGDEKAAAGGQQAGTEPVVNESGAAGRTGTVAAETAETAAPAEKPAGPAEVARERGESSESAAKQPDDALASETIMSSKATPAPAAPAVGEAATGEGPVKATDGAVPSVAKTGEPANSSPPADATEEQRGGAAS